MVVKHVEMKVRSDDLSETGNGRRSASVWVVTLARTVLNVPFRIVYPFLPSIARGLGVSLGAASALVTVRVVANLVAPLVAPFADRHGRRAAMELGMLICGMAGLVVCGLGTYAAAAVAFALFGLAKALYDPAVHAYVADRVPYEQRGRAAGLVELSWSGAWLIGVPVSGMLVERWGWRSPWAVIAGLSIASVLILRQWLPPDRPAGGRDQSAAAQSSLWASWRTILGVPGVKSLLAVSFLLTVSVEVPLIVYGAWLETAFGLGLATLGVASTVVGVAELAAEGGTTVITDRLGKVRSVLLGMAALAASLLALPILARSGLAVALAGVFCVMLSYEFAFVSFLPVISNAVPGTRATLSAINVVAFSLGRVLGTTLGGWMWRWQNMAVQCVAGALFCCCGGLLLLQKARVSSHR